MTVTHSAIRLHIAQAGYYIKTNFQPRHRHIHLTVHGVRVHSTIVAFTTSPMTLCILPPPAKDVIWSYFTKTRYVPRGSFRGGFGKTQLVRALRQSEFEETYISRSYVMAPVAALHCKLPGVLVFIFCNSPLDSSPCVATGNTHPLGFTLECLGKYLASSTVPFRNSLLYVTRKSSYYFIQSTVIMSSGSNKAVYGGCVSILLGWRPWEPNSYRYGKI
ncbi:hypothetical protein F5X96DRAFT_23390 [Biscogniauxia mediterranea]|nr:hypothetical protein F5X96DRAFT_23390 [Biscogniauxia mediterranea]